MNDMTDRYRRFVRARLRVAEARDQARLREQERRTHPPLFEQDWTEEGDR